MGLDRLVLAFLSLNAYVPGLVLCLHLRVSDHEVVAKLLPKHFDEVGGFFTTMLHLCDHLLLLPDLFPEVVLAPSLLLELHQADFALAAKLGVQLQVPAFPNVWQGF